MESNRKAPPGLNLSALPKISLIFSNNTPPALKHLSFSITVLIGFLILIGVIPVQSIAASPKHPFANFPDDILYSQAQSKHGNLESFARGRILVEPRAGLPAHVFARILEEHDGKARKIGQSNLYIIDLPEYSEKGVVARLEHHPHLKFAELDYLVPPSFVPNDRYYTYAWHLPKIGAPSAWEYSQGEGIIIAILDSGIESDHPDLAAQMVPGWNFYNNNSDTSDVYGHGTAVAGTAAATTNNEIGVSSVSGQSKIMPLRITDTTGTGYSSMIAQGITYAADHGARVANVSFRYVTNTASTRSAAQYMKDKNGLVVVAGGNTGNWENYTVTTTMIPVSGTKESDTLESWSSYGDYIALSAPGSTIWSTQIGGGYNMFGGTSIATPITAGTIALMMSANPTLSSVEIENLLFSTAVDLGAPGRDPYYGYGRVDAAAAVLAALEAIPNVDTKAPIAAIVDPLDGATVTGLVPVDIEAHDNVGVVRAELWVNNTAVAVDNSTPFAFTWDSNGAPDGVAQLTTRVFDATGNMTSSSVNVNVDNQVEPPLSSTVDMEPPVVLITNPVAGNVSGNVTISVDATDNYGTSGITQSIYIDGSLVATGTGGTLAYSWNTRPKRIDAGMHTIQAVAGDAAGNIVSTSVNVNVIK